MSSLWHETRRVLAEDVGRLSSSCEDEWALLTGEGAMLGATAWREAQVRDTRELRLHLTPFA